MMSINLSNIPILNIAGSEYCCIISLISKNKAIKIEKYKFYCHETPIYSGDVDIEKVLESNKISFG